MAKEVNKENNEAVATAVSKTEQFLSDHKKALWGIVIALVVLAGIGYTCYKFVYLPGKAQAQAQMFKAEASFAAGNWELALKGDGNTLGFEQIISDYGAKAGKAVYLYAATCQMQLGNADEALAYLAKYSTKDQIMAGRAEALKGDAYCSKGDNAKAASCFEKAAKVSNNTFSAAYLLKAGLAYEALQQYDKALSAYRTIKEEWPSSVEGYDIDKYITRVEVK